MRTGVDDATVSTKLVALAVTSSWRYLPTSVADGVYVVAWPLAPPTFVAEAQVGSVPAHVFHWSAGVPLGVGVHEPTLLVTATPKTGTGLDEGRTLFTSGGFVIFAVATESCAGPLL